tara:strand:- start:2811 stop:3428 length:618 start_codon:yes stop_codon:yes gene_type:complete
MENQKLEILVVEDTPIHQEAARELLKEYNVTIVGTFDDAVDSLHQKKYNIVLTDMFIPQGRGEMQRDKESASTPQDLGTYIAMYSAQLGVPYVAICSDSDHHDNAQTYATNDLILRQKYKPLTGSVSKPMKMGENTLLFNIFGMAYKTPDGRIGTEKEIGDLPEGSEPVKNWSFVLDEIKKYDNLKGLEQKEKKVGVGGNITLGA